MNGELEMIWEELEKLATKRTIIILLQIIQMLVVFFYACYMSNGWK